MSDSIQTLVDMIQEKIPNGVEPSFKLVVEGETPVLADKDGVRQEDGEADVSFSSSLETILAVFRGETQMQMAVMSGKVKFEGDMAAAMKLGSVLA